MLSELGIFWLEFCDIRPEFGGKSFSIAVTMKRFTVATIVAAPGPAQSRQPPPPPLRTNSVVSCCSVSSCTPSSSAQAAFLSHKALPHLHRLVFIRRCQCTYISLLLSYVVLVIIDRLFSPFTIMQHRRPTFSRPQPQPNPFPVATTSPMASSAQVVFSSDVRNMDSWAQRTGIPLTSAEALGTTYARAHRWLLSLKTQLVREHGWVDVHPSDPRMLFTIERPSRRAQNGMALGLSQRLQLPQQATSFFSPDRRVQWQMVFHSDIFATQRKLVQPLSDILNLIQCLLTGMVTLVMEEQVQDGHYETSRGLPKVEWVDANEATLVAIFGQSHYRKLYRACSDPKYSFRTEFRPASHHASR
jgi:hypothetical protein